MDEIIDLYHWIKSSHTIVVLTGAGLSVPSGIPDFRSNPSFSSEEILNYGFMVQHPDEFTKLFFQYLYHEDAKPNIAHLYLKKLMDQGRLNSIITQNVDDLHQKCGTKKIYPIHGTAHSFICMECEKKYKASDLKHTTANYCSCGGFIRPEVTLFGEPLDEAYYHLALVASQIADMYIVIGSSLSVDPAASLIRYYAGHKLVIINPSPTPYDKWADLIIREDIVDVVRKLEALEE